MVMLVFIHTCPHRRQWCYKISVSKASQHTQTHHYVTVMFVVLIPRERNGIRTFLLNNANCVLHFLQVGESESSTHFGRELVNVGSSLNGFSISSDMVMPLLVIDKFIVRESLVLKSITTKFCVTNKQKAHQKQD